MANQRKRRGKMFEICTSLTIFFLAKRLLLMHYYYCFAIPSAVTDVQCDDLLIRNSPAVVVVVVVVHFPHLCI